MLNFLKIFYDLVFDILGYVFFICRLIDSQFKFWNINKLNFLRIFKGYINEKNFVGLVIDGDYIVCGEQFFFKIYVFCW